MIRNPKSAFTLVEVIAGIVVIAAISTCSWFAASTLFRGEQLSRNRTVAINLLQKSQEEVRKASLTFYDSLENCQFPGPAFAANNITCGLQALDTNFNGYNRSVTVTPENSSTEIKKAIITVNWTDQGNNKSMNSAVLLARPPDPLPGNIIGTVRSSGTGNPLVNNAQVTVTFVGNTTSRTTTSKGVLGTKSENFDFFDSTTGAFVLPVGSWLLTATHPSYYNYTHTSDISVTSNAETTVDFVMEPKPTDATIRIRLINAVTGSPLTNFFNGLYHILDDYAETGKVIHSANNTTSGNYVITFNDVNPRSFTLNTYWAYRSGFSGQPSCTGFPYHYDGWSSAQVLDDNVTQTCPNPYNGNIASDRITVNPGDDITIQIPLFPVPTATITGKVVDQNGLPLAGAKVYAQWPTVRGSNDWWYKNGAYQFATADAAGNYTFTVPAVQEFFANNASGALKIQARRNMTYTGCCDSTQQMERFSNWVTSTNLFTGSSMGVADLIIASGGTTNCGNVQGVILDGSTNATVNGINISIQSVGTTTAGGGNYIYQCPATGYRLPVGNARFLATQNLYYGYDSAGNNWYSPAPSVNIISNTMTDYNAKLWPVGRGNIVVNVLDAGTNFPINNATVKITPYTGAITTLTTGADGKATFNNYLETWPSVNLPAIPYYNSTARSHNLNVTHSSGLYSAHVQEIPILEKGTTLTIDVKLVPAGGT